MCCNKIIDAEIKSNIFGMKICVNALNFSIRNEDYHIEKNKFRWMWFKIDKIIA